MMQSYLLNKIITACKIPRNSVWQQQDLNVHSTLINSILKYSWLNTTNINKCNFWLNIETNLLLNTLVFIETIVIHSHYKSTYNNEIFATFGTNGRASEALGLH